MTEYLTIQTADIVRLLVAFLLGAMIGGERELRDKAAGLRTMIMICVGSALFTIFSIKIAGDNDPGRIAAQVVTGVGFLGAGVILHRGHEVRGLTTASTIWFVAALGVGVGGGYLLFAFAAALVAILVLSFVPVFERRIDVRDFRTYLVTTRLDPAALSSLAEMFRTSGLRAKRSGLSKRGEFLSTTWEVYGPRQAHESAERSLLTDPGIIKFQN